MIAGTEVHRQPITTILSGPAAGTLGAALVAGQAGFSRVITLDGGGTSTDVAVISDGRPSLTTEGSVGRFAVKVPMVDVVTVGTGGGSIAWVSPEGTLKVGPRSAGASPGPACYPDGGSEPTTTDAFLLLGHIPEHLLGGEIPLDRVRRRGRLRAAGRGGRPRRRGVRGRRARDRRLEPGERDPPGHRQARARRPRLRRLRVRRLGTADRVPADRHPRAADGVRPARPRQPERVRAARRPTCGRITSRRSCAATTSSALDELAGEYARLEADALAALDRQGHTGDRMCLRSADLRYFGQAFEIHVPAPDGAIDARVRRRGRGALPRRPRARLRLRATATTRTRSSSG